jgi:hypothetical protein
VLCPDVGPDLLMTFMPVFPASFPQINAADNQRREQTVSVPFRKDRPILLPFQTKPSRVIDCGGRTDVRVARRSANITIFAATRWPAFHERYGDGAFSARPPIMRIFGFMD